MPIGTITNTLLDPDLDPIPGVRVDAYLTYTPAHRIDTATAILPPESVVSDGSGVWSIDLEQSANISNGSQWMIHERVPFANGGSRFTMVNVIAGTRTLLAATVSSYTPPATDTYYTADQIDTIIGALVEAAIAGLDVVTSVNTETGDVVLSAADVGAAASAHKAIHENGGADELALDASQTTTGQFAIARLAAGIPDGTKFVRDDGTLAVPPGGGGIVDSVVAGTNVTVDATDPANPIVSAIGGGAVVEWPLFMADDFTRANSATTIGTPPDRAFNTDTYDETDFTGEAGINTNALYVASGSGAILIDTRTSLHELGFTVGTGGGPFSPSAVVAWVDADNFVGVDASDGYAYHTVGGVTSDDFNFNAGWAEGDVVIVALEEVGDDVRLTLTVNGTPRTVLGSPAPVFTVRPNGTKAGFNYFDNLDSHTESMYIRVQSLVAPDRPDVVTSVNGDVGVVVLAAADVGAATTAQGALADTAVQPVGLANYVQTTDARFTTITANNQIGTTYTLVLTDAGKVIECNNASPIALTVPPNSSVAFPVGTVIEVWMQGAGAITITAGSGVTIRSPGSDLIINTQYATAVLRKRATDEWVLDGRLA